MEQQLNTLIVTGEANKSFTPDQIRIHLHHEEKRQTYAETLTALMDKTKEIKEDAIRAGLSGADVKTLSFKVEPHYESYRDAKGDYKKRFDGYAGYANFSIDLPFDNASLSKTLTCLSIKDVSFSYMLSDPLAAKDEVTALAVSIAVNRANVIAKAAGITLGPIQNIDYGVRRVHIDYDEPRVYECACANGPAPEIDITPEDLSMSDNVTITWAIA